MAGPAVSLEEASRRVARLRGLTITGVAAAAVIAVCCNVLVGRFYKRWDWTSQGLYTLSHATLETLHGLDAPIDVVVFLSASDPLTVSVRHMLDAYGAETRMLRPKFVDPDRSPAEFMVLQEKYGIRVEGKTEDGRLVTDAALVVSKGKKRWFLTAADIFAYDDEGRVKSKLEQSLTGGIRNVVGEERTKICFTQGHGEISSDDGGAQGLGELRFRLQKNNYEAIVVDLAQPERNQKLSECGLMLIAGPEQPFTKKAAARVDKYLVGGGNVFLLVNPMLDDEIRIIPTGLEALARKGGIELGGDFVLERDGKHVLPIGIGESFFALPAPHAITRGLIDEVEDSKVRVLVRNAQSLRRSKGEQQPVSLLSTSGEAFSVTDIRPFVQEGALLEKGPGDEQGPFSVAMAAELPKPAGSDAAHGPRIVVAGSANLVWAGNWRDPTTVGDRVLVESAISWLAARPVMVDVPEKAAQEAGLRLTEESMSDVLLYVLLYLPGATVILGGVVMYRRRLVERRSRRDRHEKSAPKSRPSSTDGDDADETDSSDDDSSDDDSSDRDSDEIASSDGDSKEEKS